MSCIDVNNGYAGGSIFLTLTRDTTDGSTVTFDEMLDVIVKLYINETVELLFSKVAAEDYTQLIRVDADTFIIAHDGVEEKGLMRMRVELILPNAHLPEGQKLTGEEPLINLL